MKLTSTARLRIATVAITTIVTATIGILVTQQSYNNSIRSIDQALNFTIEDAATSPGTELTAALYHLEEFSLDQTLFLLSRDGTPTLVSESTIQLFDEISLDDALAATTEVKAGFGKSEYRFRTLLISGGDYLVVASSSADALDNYHSNLLSVAFATIVISLIAFLLFALYTRRLKARDDVEALARMQSFLGDASHELRTPLTVVKGYVEMLSSGMMTDPADRTRAFARVTEQISRMEILINDILLLAELGENGERQGELVDISAITSEHVQDFITLNSQRKVSLSITPDIQAHLVREYFQRFLQNALNNITIHTPGDASVSISLLSQGKQAILMIEDGGPGLPEEGYREKIQFLNRFDQSRSREKGGSGLGMSIMAGVIRKSGGEFSLRKSELGGLAVIANIPRYR